MGNRNPESIARTRREEARVEAISAMQEGRRLWHYGQRLARAYGHTDLLPQNAEHPQA